MTCLNATHSAEIQHHHFAGTLVKCCMCVLTGLQLHFHSAFFFTVNHVRHDVEVLRHAVLLVSRLVLS